VRALHAAALGALHGPAELVPVSSSAHVGLLARLAGWDGATGAEGKQLEVALHAGTGAGLAWLLRRDALAALRALDGRRVALHALALGVPSLAGLALERPVQERLGRPGTTAAGLVAGSALLLAADAAPPGGRAARDAGPADGLVLGLAQAAALAPGVSRRGATLAAARLRGFDRAAASALSWEVGLPVLVAATALKALRLAQAPPPRRRRRALAAGALAALGSTLACAPALRAAERGPWWPYAAERLVVAGLAAAHARRRACKDRRR